MWQLLKALWGKIAGQAPPAPPAAAPRPPLDKRLVQQPSPQNVPAAEAARKEEAPEPTPEHPAPKVAAAQRGEEPVVWIPSQEKSPDSVAVESPTGPAQPTSTAKSISSLWAMTDTGSRISCIAATTDSGRAVSSIATARLRQSE
ncbi:outer membrane biosynthesis protein TonB [Thermostichus sp. MS-CIW-36]